MGFVVLVICTGNICRSPVAERLLRARIQAAADIDVASAGTHGVIGRPIDHDSATALRELGVDPAGHVARRLDVRMLSAADLILTATVAHRSIVLEADPLLLAKTFTLREFARLAALPPDLAAAAEGVPTAAELRNRVGAIARRRGGGDAAGAANDDIADPYGASIKGARTAAAEIADAVTGIADGLGLPTADAPSPGRAHRPPGPSLRPWGRHRPG